MARLFSQDRCWSCRHGVWLWAGKNQPGIFVPTPITKNNGHTASRRRCVRSIYALSSMPSGEAQFCCSLMVACAAGQKVADILLCIADRQGTAVSDAKGNTTTTSYDSKGRLTKKTLQMKEALCILTQGERKQIRHHLLFRFKQII